MATKDDVISGADDLEESSVETENSVDQNSEDGNVISVSEDAMGIGSVPEEAEEEVTDGVLAGLEELAAPSDETNVGQTGFELSESSTGDYDDGADHLDEMAEEREEDGQDDDARRTKNTSAVTKDRRRRNSVRARRLAEQEKDERRMKLAAVWSKLVSARRREQILTGEIIGCKILPNDPQIFVVVLYGGVHRVFIPFQNFFVDVPITENVDTSTPEGIRNFVMRQRAMIEKMYGAETPFIVTDIRGNQSDGYVVIASRAAALQRRATENFTPDDYGDAVIEVGDVVLATILSVSDHSVLVNAGGIDSRIHIHNLTYRYIPHMLAMEQVYQVGQEIPVMVMDVKRNASGHYTCLLSGRQAELEDAKKRHYLFCNPGDMTVATISNVYRRKSGDGVAVALYIDCYDLPAIAGNVSPNGIGRFPIAGDRVRVSFRNYNAETGMTFVGIRGNHGMVKF